MISLKNARYSGSENRWSTIDLTIPDDFNGRLITFVHGYMGFKDWGAWQLMEDFFVQKGFGFCKFNLSHNGGTAGQPIDFPDLEAFSKNTYSKEKQDVQFALNWIESQFSSLPEIHLTGHSRGGGSVLLNADDQRVTSIITLAAISSVADRFSDPIMIENWKKDGIRYVTNQRTQQQMPHDLIQYTDFIQNQETLNIEKACKENKKPILIIHGDKDTSVNISEGKSIAHWVRTDLTIIENADHVYGASQPWKSKELPGKLKEVCHKMNDFLKKIQ